MEFDEQQLWGEGVADNHLAAGMPTIRGLAALSAVHCLCAVAAATAWPQSGNAQTLQLRAVNAAVLSEASDSIIAVQPRELNAFHAVVQSCTCILVMPRMPVQCHAQLSPSTLRNRL